MLILLTNDDGVDAVGLTILREKIRILGDVVVCAPNRNCSASSRKLTLDRPLHIREIEPAVFSIDGSPADCVLLAIHQILQEKPAIVISGINSGANLGQDIFYSGTVGAAMEARIHGVPAAAISLASRAPEGMPAAGDVALWVAQHMLQGHVPDHVVLNVNVPSGITTPGAKLTRLGRRTYEDLVTVSRGPRDRIVYWIGGNGPTWEEDPFCDAAAIAEGLVSVTPLGEDLTEYRAIRHIKLPGLRFDEELFVENAGQGSQA